MKTVKISLNSIDKVKAFVNDITKFDYDFDLVSGRYVIDAKSIMGIFSLDLSKPIDLNIHAEDNVDAVLEVIKFIYDNIIYAELNTKSDYCQVCGWDGEIEIVKDEETGKLVWECPNCKNRNQDTMNVARRTCGYIGSNFWN